MSRTKCNNIEIFSRFEEIRNYYNLTQKEFSVKLNITHSYYSGIKMGKAGFSFKMLCGIAENFINIDIGWLLTGEGTMLKAAHSVVDDSRGAYETALAHELYEKLKTLPKKQQAVALNMFKSILELILIDKEK